MGKIGIKIKEQKPRDPGKAKKAKGSAGQPREPFTPDEFLESWNALAASLKEESLALFMAMTKETPRLQDDCRVLITVDNAIQADLIREKTPELLAHLHQELRNCLIRIETRIENGKSRQKAYLPKEKLQELIKKNPHIRDLRDGLGLELDY